MEEHHELWTSILEQFVDENGYVDYQGLAADRDELDRYLNWIERVSPRSDPELFSDRDQELAYYINAYNALVFDGVLDRGPETESVWKGGLISGRQFFVKRDVVLGGEQTNLKSLEDDWIREGFEDPRIHAAVNCASISCPRLPREAFYGARLDEQLDAAMREFVSDQRHVRVRDDGDEVKLSKIFHWFEDDFLEYLERQGVSDPTLLDYVNRYREETEQVPSDVDVDFFEYDKGINSQRNAPSAG